MKRFLLFAFNAMWPAGGWEDLVAGYDSFEEAQARAETLRSKYYQIVDAERGEILETNQRDY